MGGPARKAAPADWSVIFDTIASEYGYTWEQFAGMTYKLLDSCLEKIAARTHNKTAILAAMHGIKIELYQKPTPVSEKTLEYAAEETQKILKQKQIAAKNGKRQ